MSSSRYFPADWSNLPSIGYNYKLFQNVHNMNTHKWSIPVPLTSNARARLSRIARVYGYRSPIRMLCVPVHGFIALFVVCVYLEANIAHKFELPYFLPYLPTTRVLSSMMCKCIIYRTRIAHHWPQPFQQKRCCCSRHANNRTHAFNDEFVYIARAR